MQKIAFRYGLWLFIGLTGFFLLMHLFNLSENYYLRVFNGVIHLGIIWTALSAWSRDHYGAPDDYFNGVVLGMYTSFVGITPFAAFMAIFLQFNPAFLSHMRAAMPIGENLNPITSSLFVLAEGVAISLIGSYIIIRIMEVRRGHVH